MADGRSELPRHFGSGRGSVHARPWRLRIPSGAFGGCQAVLLLQAPELHYESCGYGKMAGACSVPTALAGCKVPALPGRNGRLNQTAVSLFLFIRDVADGDLLGWIDSELQAHSDRPASERARHLVDAMRSIFGVADKLLCMALSSLLLGVGRKNPLWFETGACLIVVDTLVHNFMHRTGIMRARGNEHAFGLRCYEPMAARQPSSLQQHILMHGYSMPIILASSPA